MEIWGKAKREAGVAGAVSPNEQTIKGVKFRCWQCHVPWTQPH